MIPKEQIDIYQKEDEINLKEFIENSIKGIKKNFVLIICFVVTGVLFGFTGSKLIKPVYKSHLILSASPQLGSNSINIINNWSEFINKRDYSPLSSTSNIPVRFLETINEINAETKENNEIEKNFKSKTFVIHISVSRNGVLDSLEKMLISYLYNSSVKNNLEKQIRLSVFKKNIEREISSLDSIKLDLKKLVDRGQSLNNPFLTEPGNLNISFVDLYGRKSDLEEEIIALNKIQVVESFIKSDVPDNANLPKFLTTGVFAGLALSLITIFFKSIMEG